MKTLTWNVNKAAYSREQLWCTLLDEDADIVVLQEVTSIPSYILDRYNCYAKFPKFFEGHNAPSQTAVLSKWKIDRQRFLTSDLEWVNRIHNDQYGWIIECEVTDDVGIGYRVVAVHLPAFPIPEDVLEGVDVSVLKLTIQKKKIWFSEILWSLLQTAPIDDTTNWIVTGDFNSSVKLDIPKDRGNHEIVERLNSLGLIDCLSYFGKGAVPTFQSPRKYVEHQLDYCYVSPSMLARLKSASVMDRDKVFGGVPKLSDHLPILCEFG